MKNLGNIVLWILISSGIVRVFIGFGLAWMQFKIPGAFFIVEGFFLCGLIGGLVSNYVDRLLREM